MNNDKELIATYLKTFPRSEDCLTRIPSYMVGAYLRYMNHGIPPGDFLYSLLCGDAVWRVYARADECNQAAMKAWAQLLYDHAPSPAIGTVERVNAWIKSGGLQGLKEPST